MVIELLTSSSFLSKLKLMKNLSINHPGLSEQACGLKESGGFFKRSKKGGNEDGR